MSENETNTISCENQLDKRYPDDRPIVIGRSIVCDGYVSGKTTAVFTHFHDDHTWNFKRTLSNCDHIILTEPTYRALQALKNIPDRGNIVQLRPGRIFTTNYGEQIELIDANHVCGSCQVFVTIEDSQETILYSGDFCFPDISTPKADTLILDGTHGTELYDFKTDKKSVLRALFKEVCDAIKENRAVEIRANRGTMQDIMEQLEKTEKGENGEKMFIDQSVPFLADLPDVKLTNAIKDEYKENFRDIEVVSNNRLDELYYEKEEPYVRFARPNVSTPQEDRALVIQADVNTNYKTKGPWWHDKNGKFYACLSAHAPYGKILEYVKAVSPKRVIVDGTRENGKTKEISKSLAITIEKELKIPAVAKICG